MEARTQARQAMLCTSKACWMLPGAALTSSWKITSSMDAQSRGLQCSAASERTGRAGLCCASALATPKGTHFLRLVDCSECAKGGRFLFERLAESCEEVGPEHIVAVIMDGASANESAGKLLEER